MYLYNTKISVCAVHLIVFVRLCMMVLMDIANVGYEYKGR